MRLTLRSMLAYLDEILEPADAAVIEEKIKESEFASGLMQRIRDVTRKLRLAAPKVEGPGMGLDPNTVAEYLDNTLPAERVPDFERVCLESDVHLAEVAASHQILTLVLGEPAEVHPDSRNKMYRLTAGQTDSTALKSGPDGAHDRVDSPPGRPARKRPEVPSYLRDSATGGRIWLWAAAAVLLVIIGGVALLAIGPPSIRSLLVSAPRDDDPLASTGQQEGSSPDTGNPVAPPEPAAGDTADNDGTDERSDAGPIDMESPTDGAELRLPADAAGDGADETTISNGADDPPPVAPLPPEATEAVDGNTAPDVADSGDAASAVADGSDSVTPEANREPEGVGRFFSEKDVLLVTDLEGQPWRRLAARELLFPGERLLALPTYRPSLALSAGARLELVGDSMVELLDVDPEGVPGLNIVYGRAVLMATAKPGTKVRLRVGGADSVVTFGDAESTLAVEVRTVRSEGSNPETEPGELSVDLYAVTGDIRWQHDPAAEPVLASAPAHWRATPGNALPPETVNELPSWVTPGELSYRDQHGNLFVEENLPTDRPVSLSLRELADHRREEVRSLAARSLALIGEFGPFVSVLNDRRHKSAWRYEIENLREAISRSPRTAARVREAFEDSRGPEDGPELFRMLWGYNDQQIADGATGLLLDRLDHDDLDFRVLAIWNLQLITGRKLFYHPDQSADQRRRHVQRWRDSLQGNSPAAANGPP